MSVEPAKKKILVLSDSDKIAKVIKLTLDGGMEVQVTDPAANWEPSCGDFDLLVMALSSHLSEPVVKLLNASLVNCVGQVPLLIISDRPFDPDPGGRITHLDFPFDIDDLRDRVQELLKQPATIH